MTDETKDPYNGSIYERAHLICTEKSEGESMIPIQTVYEWLVEAQREATTAAYNDAAAIAAQYKLIIPYVATGSNGEQRGAIEFDGLEIAALIMARAKAQKAGETGER